MGQHETLQQKIRFEEFGYRFPAMVEGADPTTAVENVSFSVAAGGFLGITGTTGSGKSTLCLAMNGLVPHATGGIIRGDVYIDETNTKRSSVPQLARQVGLVFQDPESNLVGLNVEDEVAFGPENLGVPPDEISRRIDWSLGIVGMESFRRRSSAQLSGGQKQRVAIAAVLSMQPEVLVLDEPTAQLDPVGKVEVAHAVAELRRRRGQHLTVVMVEQDAELMVRLAERMIVLDAGRIVAAGTPEQVFSGYKSLIDRGVSCPQLAEVSGQISEHLGQPIWFMNRDDAQQQIRTLLTHGTANNE